FSCARCPRPESLASQLPEWAESRFSVLALASSRQREYFAADFSLPNSHLPGGAAHAAVWSTRTPARAAVARTVGIFLMVVAPHRWSGDDPTVTSRARPRPLLASCRAIPARPRRQRTHGAPRRSPLVRWQPTGSRPPREPTCGSARDSRGAARRR